MADAMFIGLAVGVSTADRYERWCPTSLDRVSRVK
jgi:hypothetical protein